MILRIEYICPAITLFLNNIAVVLGAVFVKNGYSPANTLKLPIKRKAAVFA